ncbi:hypothetical protein [Aeoliella mucimassa]|uniref:Uncharacterized protein n=1 Tax=Aeoliella mucimassa TaxID=2527972 RepID=A0A518AIE9_9BACT|nr:hypothetical protein [Aeoliella mucimassa]QDU54513.1 hypothetical protein Pan181_06950 [Aeoliella mucimassa]
MSDDLNPFASPEGFDNAGFDPASQDDAWTRENPAAMRKVRTGLTLVYFGICGMVLSVLAMALGGIAGILAIMYPGIVVLVISTIAVFVGECFCMAAPAESGARFLAQITVGIQVLNFVMSFVVEQIDLPFQVEVGLNWILGLANLAATICFVLFLRTMALYIARPDIAKQAMMSLVVGVVSGVCFIVIAVLSVALQMEPLGTLFIPVLIGFLVSFVMFANSVNNLRKAITV